MKSLAFALIVALPFAAAAPVPKEVKSRPDPERFVGVWDTVESQSNGQEYSKARWTFDEKLKMTSRSPGITEGGSVWAIKIDPETKPKTIDIGAYPGIYEFDGDDIKIAYKISGERPTEIDSKNGQYFCRLRRVTDTKK